MPAVVQSASGRTFASTVPVILGIAYPGAVTAGNLLVGGVMAFYSGTTPTISISDTLSSTWSAAIAPSTLVGIMQMFYAVPASSGSNTVTATVSGASSNAYTALWVAEYSGLPQTVAVDQATNNTGTSAQSSLALTITSSTEILVAQSNQGSASVADVTGSFTQREASMSGDVAADLITSAPGAYTALFDLTGSDTWATQGVSFMSGVRSRVTLLGSGI